MKIWLDSASPWNGEGIEMGECPPKPPPECNSASFVRFAPGPVTNLYKGDIHLATPHWIQSCADGRWLACNPVGSGQIAVLDEQARQVLELFRIPRPLHEAYPLLPQVPPEIIRSAALIFWNLSLLQDAHKPVFQTVRRNDTLLTAWLHITNACNLACQYCYIQKSSERMSEDTALRAVDAIFRSAHEDGYKQVRIKYAGGEASLEIRRVLAVHDYAARQAHEYGIQLHGLLLSNGVSLSQRLIEQLKERRIAVAISLDGIGSYHDAQRPFMRGQGSFIYVDRSIKRLLAHQLVPHITVTISQQNLAGLPDLLAYILQKNLPFSLNFYRDNEYAIGREQLLFEEQQMIDAMRETFRVIEAQLPRRPLLNSLLDRASLQTTHRHACSVGENYLVIDQHGGVSKCHAAQQHRITTIAAAHPLKVIQNDRTGIQNLSVEEKEGCRSCTWRYWCSGGCSLLTYRFTGRYDVKSPNCRIYQELFPDVVRLEALRLLRYTAPLDLERVDETQLVM